MDLNTIAVDVTKESDGVWEQVDETTSILVARLFNPNFNKLFERLSAPHRRAARTGLLSEEKSEEILVECYAKTVLLDWKGLKENGEDVPYSVEKAKEILSDKRFRMFRELVIELANAHTRYREEEIADTAGKSASASSGNSNGESTKNSSLEKSPEPE